MKTILAVGAMFFILVLAGCSTESENNNNNNQNQDSLVKMIIKNESSWPLYDLRFSGVSFSAELARTSQVEKQVEQGSTGYILFSLTVQEGKGSETSSYTFEFRTADIFSANDAVNTLTFIDTTLIQIPGHDNQKMTLKQFIMGPDPELEVLLGTYLVDRNGSVNLTSENNLALGNTLDTEFKLWSTGKEQMWLKGTTPITVTGGDSSVFKVVQPQFQYIPNGYSGDASSMPFTIKFTPPAARTYTATVTISIKEPTEDIFSFTITATGQ